MALFSTSAIVLGGIRLGEADKLVTFFTLTRGKLKGVAKGARRMKSRFGATLEPFTHCKLVVFDKGTEKLARIEQCDILHSFQSLREDWGGIERSSRMVDLVAQMTPDGQANTETFDLLLQGLFFLEEKKDPPLSVMLFISRLIACSGYQPHWDSCLKCRLPFKPGKPEALYFSPGVGGALCAKCGKMHVPSIPMSQGTRAFLSASQKMDYERAHRLRPSLQIQKECEAIFKHTLSHITGKSTRRFTKNPGPTLGSTRL
ncbi:MAG: DNA repair protein RecO [Nitrospirota bacterium]|nr:DNA repair protein RecO [Nitrospirota bacterium]